MTPPPHWAWGILQIAEALEEAHEQGVIHREQINKLRRIDQSNDTTRR
jgi:hypothetical protein